MGATNNRLFLIHWNAEEAGPLAEPLAEAGWQVEIESADGARAVNRILAEPPAAVVIYLTRLPSHGRKTASYLHSKSDLPVIFVDGPEDKLAGIQEAVPGASFVKSADLHSTLNELL